MLTVADVYAYVNGRAPFDTQMDFDNAGLLTGAMEQPVTGIHVALDCTEGVIQEAEHLGANLIVTHHPLMFHARKRMTEEDAEGRLLCRLIRGHMALLAAHTNLDRAAGGINDVLAEVCGLRDTVGEEFLRVGDLPAPMEARELQAYLSDRLGTVVRLMGRAGQQVSRLGVSSGAGGDGWPLAKALGADAFLSGEIRHHEGLDCVANGLVALEGGHFATEAPGIFALANALQTHLNAIQCNVCVSKSLIPGYQG